MSEKDLHQENTEKVNTLLKKDSDFELIEPMEQQNIEILADTPAKPQNLPLPKPRKKSIDEVYKNLFDDIYLSDEEKDSAKKKAIAEIPKMQKMKSELVPESKQEGIIQQDSNVHNVLDQQLLKKLRLVINHNMVMSIDSMPSSEPNQSPGLNQDGFEDKNN